MIKAPSAACRAQPLRVKTGQDLDQVHAGGSAELPPPGVLGVPGIILAGCWGEGKVICCYLNYTGKMEEG